MTYWLKLWGRGVDPYEDGRLPLDHLTFGKARKPRVEMGDQLVILGVGTGGKLVATETSTSGITKPGTHPEWPYRCETRVDLLCEVARAPWIGVLPDAENLKRWLNTRAGYRRITKEQFETAELAIRTAGGKAPK